MIDLGAAAAHAAGLAVGLPAWRAFRAALDDPRAAQAAALRGILAAGAGSAFARAHGLSAAADVDALRRAVPPRTYDELRPWIARAASGEPEVLTASPVRRFLPSSGSAAATKLLPWTAPLEAEMRRAITPWLADMAIGHPALLGGPAYWSVSPAAPPRKPTAGGAPVGLEDDAAYLGPVARRLARWGLAVPGEVRHVPDVDAWRRRTLLHLVRARELRLISVWSPSFLALLLARMADLFAALVADVAAGSPPLRAAGGVLPALAADRRRARELERAGPDPVRLWPRLALVSCWTDGPSAAEAHRLSRSLPGVQIAPKGLVATEGVISIPFGAARPLAIRSHLLELEVAGVPRLVHELREGDVGSVIVTTGGGLWRYRLQDRVEVTGFVGRTPSIRFLGKEDHVCDLAGEKLHAGLAEEIVLRLRRGRELPAEGLAFLAPEDGPARGTPGYTLFVAAAAVPPGTAARLEALLRESFHYEVAARLGQLAPARVYLVAGDATEAFHRACAARGQRLGDVKASALRRERDWAARLPGAYAES